MIEVLMGCLVATVAIGAIPATAYPVQYYRGSNWRATETGRALMTKGIAIALLFDVNLLLFVTRAWLPLWLVLLVQIMLNAFVVVAVSFQYRVMRRAQKRGPRTVQSTQF